MGGGFFTTELFGQSLNQLFKKLFFFSPFVEMRFRGLEKILSFTPLFFFLEGGVMDRLDVHLFELIKLFDSVFVASLSGIY